MWASSWENLSVVFEQARLKPATSASAATVESWNLGFSKQRHCTIQEQQRHWSDCADRRLICTFFSHMEKTRFLTMWLVFAYILVMLQLKINKGSLQMIVLKAFRSTILLYSARSSRHCLVYKSYSLQLVFKSRVVTLKSLLELFHSVGFIFFRTRQEYFCATDRCKGM